MKAVSLFSGVGGFELGFERAGIETVLQAERDPWCLRLLRRHYPTTVRINDVHKVSLARAHNAARRWDARRGHDWHHEQDEPEPAAADCSDAQRLGADVCGAYRADGGEWDRSIGGDGAHARWDGRGSCIDLVYGGFPCQDLSVAGKRAGLGGGRSGLWFEFHRVLRELRPRWAVIENVPGLLSSNQGRDFAVILDGLGELGFDVAWAVLDARHFGVPQRRRRVFVVAGPSRRAVEQVLSLCESCGGNPPPGRTPGQDVAYSLTASVRGTGDGHGNAWNTSYIAAPLGSHHRRDDLDNDTYVLASAVSASAGHHGHSSPRGDGSDNLLIGTITANWHKGAGNTQVEMGIVQPTAAGVRRLTPLECERLMGWPDDHTRFTADGTEIADSHRYRMCGNGVVASVAEWIGRRLVVVDAAL